MFIYCKVKVGFFIFFGNGCISLNKGFEKFWFYMFIDIYIGIGNIEC